MVKFKNSSRNLFGGSSRNLLDHLPTQFSPKKELHQSLLLVQDTEDSAVHLLSNEPSYFKGLSSFELEEEFKKLIRSAKPVFSGSLDHRVNCLDIIKVKNFLNQPEG